MAAYDDSFRASIVSLRDGIISKLQEQGLVFAEHPVKFAYETITGGDDARGIPGTSTVTYKVLTPVPKIELRAQYRAIRGVQTYLGDALMTASRGAFTREELVGVSWVEVGSDRYGIISGSHEVGTAFTFIKELPFTWKVILKRELQ